MIVAERTERAWAAGFFDGEGNAGFYPKKGGSITVNVVQNTREEIDRFEAVFGFGRIFLDNQGKWRWVATRFEYVQAVAGILWPFMCSKKRAQLARALAGHKANRFALRRKLSYEQVHEIRRSPETATALAARFGVTATIVCRIRRGEAYRGVAL